MPKRFPACRQNDNVPWLPRNENDENRLREKRKQKKRKMLKFKNGGYGHMLFFLGIIGKWCWCGCCWCGLVVPPYGRIEQEKNVHRNWATNRPFTAALLNAAHRHRTNYHTNANPNKSQHEDVVQMFGMLNYICHLMPCLFTAHLEIGAVASNGPVVTSE